MFLPERIFVNYFQHNFLVSKVDTILSFCFHLQLKAEELIRFFFWGERKIDILLWILAKAPDSKEAEKTQEEEKKEEPAESEEKQNLEQGQKEADATIEKDNASIIDRLCKFIYTKASDRVRTRAMLCHIYHHALHDRLYEARDLMLISHLQETIQHSDVSTQVSDVLKPSG